MLLTSSTEILIGDMTAQHVLIRPLSRSHPGLFDHSDGNWIDCELEVVAGGFRGSFRADLRSEEFQAFLEQLEGLRRTFDSTASFRTIEGQLTLTLTGDSTGVVHVTGEAIDETGVGNRLQFGFDLDQTYLESARQSLESLLAAFPVVGSALS
jgi:hypothetical protein